MTNEPPLLSPARPRPAARQRFAGPALALLAITLAAYLPAFRAGYIWDDDTYVVNNALLRTTGGLAQIWLRPGATPQYYPLVYTTYWLEYHAWGTSPAGYHVVNVLLHAANAVLVWLVLRRLRVPAAWLAAAVFTLHPVHVQSVAWIAERKNTLSALFCLLSLLAYCRYLPLPAGEGVRPRKHQRWYVLALLAFLAAMLCKTAVGPLPAAVLVLIWWQRGRLTTRDILPLLPFFLITVALGLVTVSVEAAGIRRVSAPWNLAALERVLLAGRCVWFYARQLIWPAELIHVYPRWTIAAALWWQYLYPAAAVALLAVLWAARRILGRGPLAAALLFGGMLLPMLGAVQFGYQQFSFVADHFVYLPSLGLIVLLVALGDRLAERLGPAVRRAAPVLAGIVLIALGSTTFRQCRIYRNAETLWRDTLAKAPTVWVANTLLGATLAQTGRPAEAIPYFEAALRLDPGDLATPNNLANAYLAVGRRHDAQAMYEDAIARDPRNALAHYNLGGLLVQDGLIPAALEHYAHAVRIAPGLQRARQTLHITLAQFVTHLILRGDARQAADLAEHIISLAGTPDETLLNILDQARRAAGGRERSP